jgi:hypothetical protein
MGALVFLFFQDLGRAYYLAGPIAKRGLPVSSECRIRQLKPSIDLFRG